MDRKLLNKVMKRLAVSNVVKDALKEEEKEVSPSLPADRCPDRDKTQEKLEHFLLDRYDFRFNVLTNKRNAAEKEKTL